MNATKNLKRRGYTLSHKVATEFTISDTEGPVKPPDRADAVLIVTAEHPHEPTVQSVVLVEFRDDKADDRVPVELAAREIVKLIGGGG